MAKYRKISPAELNEALDNPDEDFRYRAIFDFAHGDMTPDAVPVLRRGLADPYFAVVRYAAKSLGKLGPAALPPNAMDLAPAAPVVMDLLKAATRYDDLLTPQAYWECVEALIRITPTHPLVFALIATHIGLDYKISLMALRAIGTPKAVELMKRALMFYLPELDKREKRIAREIVAGKRKWPL